MSFVLSDFGFTLGLFVALLLCFDLGRRFGVGRLSLDPDGVTKGSGPVEAAVFGLLGLLLAFTFSGAATRFEERRFLIATEANDISTAYQRVGKGRNWFYMLLFSTTISLTLYVIIDMEYPRYGLIRVDAADQTLMDLRELMQ